MEGYTGAQGGKGEVYCDVWEEENVTENALRAENEKKTTKTFNGKKKT